MVCSRSASCLFQPALPTALRMLTKVMMRVSSRRKCVCMSMMNWSLNASARSWAIAGVAASALAHLEQRAVDLVHRDERRGHAGGGLEELAAVQPLLAAELVGHGEQARLDLALPLVLRVGIEFVAGDDLGRDRRLVLAQFGRHQRGKFFFGQLAAHGGSPCCALRLFRLRATRRLDLLRGGVSLFRNLSRDGVCAVQRTRSFKPCRATVRLRATIQRAKWG